MRQMSLSYFPGAERGGRDWGEAIYFDLDRLKEEVGRYAAAVRRRTEEDLEVFTTAVGKRIREMEDHLEERMRLMRGVNLPLPVEGEENRQRRIRKRNQ